ATSSFTPALAATHLYPLPYTTLFRSEADRVMQHRRDDPGRPVGRGRDHAAARGVLLVHRQGVEVHPFELGEGGVLAEPGALRLRSEEHTSELQSRFDLVCSRRHGTMK